MVDKELFPLKSDRAGTKDLRQIVLAYLRYWYLFLLGAVLSVGIAKIYLSYYTVPLYVVSCKLLIKDDNSSTSDVSSSALNDLNMFKASKNIDNELEVLRSESLMQRVVKELELATTYYIEGRFKDVEVYSKSLPVKVAVIGLDSTAYGKTLTINLKPDRTFVLVEESGETTSHKLGEKIVKPYGIFSVEASEKFAAAALMPQKSIIVHFDNMRNVARHYSNALQIVQLNKNSSVLKISLMDPLPEKGKDILNKLVEVYNKEAIEDKNLMATNTLIFLDERLKYITTELSQVEKDVEQFKRVNELTDMTTQASNYLDQANSYNKQLSEWAIQIDVLESIEKYLDGTGNHHKVVPSTLGIQDPTLVALIARFNELQLERERMLKTIQPGSPLIQNINEQLADLRTNILENLRNIKQGLIITSNNLKSSSGQYKAKIKQVPTMERALLEINRQQAIKQNIYLYLLQKREETALTLAASVSNSRIIDPAMGGDYPVAPKKSTIYLMALLLGLSIPFAGLYIRDLFDDKIHTKQEVEQATGTPVLGEIALHKSGSVVVTKGNRSPIAEMFGHIRAKLKYIAVHKENKVILVTSSMSGEGKTFFCINLGASLVLANKKVVLLELDLRNPNLSQEIGLLRSNGVTDYLVSNDLMIHDIIKHPERAPGLAVISSGFIPPDPAELMMSPKLTYLIEQLKESYDHVIIDTAPIGLVADAFSLGSVTDSTIYLVRYDFTSKKQLEIIDNIHRSKALNQPMIVLNGAKKGGTYSYGYEYKARDNKKKKAVT